MATLVSQSEIDIFTGDFRNLFDTFKRTIRIHKEPKKILGNINSNNTLHGYGTQSNETNIQYVAVYQDFQTMVSYKDMQESNELGQIKEIRYFAGDVRIKVDEDAKNYIENGKTEKVEIDGKSFQVMTERSIKYFFGLKLYVYHLQFTK